MEWYIKWLYAWRTLSCFTRRLDGCIAVGTWDESDTSRRKIHTESKQKVVHEYIREMCSFALAISPLSTYEERQWHAEREEEMQKARVTTMCNENERAGNGWVWHKWRVQSGIRVGTVDKFSPDDLFLMRRTSLGWIPWSWSCARIYQHRGINPVQHQKQHAHASSAHWRG